MERQIAFSGFSANLNCGLARRELECLLALTAGLTDKQIAARDGLSPRSIKGRIESAMFKLQVYKRSALVAEAFKRGIIAPACVAFLAVVLVGQHHQATAIRRPDAPRRIEMRVTARRDACAWVA